MIHTSQNLLTNTMIISIVGYVVFIDKYDSKSIEKELIVHALKGNITIKKIDVSLIKASMLLEKMKNILTHYLSLHK